MSDPYAIKLLVLDVDGVLTDGGITIDSQGVEIVKRFHVRDGLGIQLAMEQGLKVAVLSSRLSRAVDARLRELGVTLLMQGARDKGAGLRAIAQQAGVDPAQAAYMGDDLLDLPAMLRCGYKITVADAAPELRQIADYVTGQPGGHGAVREAVEHLLKAQNKWQAVLDRFGFNAFHQA